MSLSRPVWVIPGRKPQRQVFSWRGSNTCQNTDEKIYSNDLKYSNKMTGLGKQCRPRSDCWSDCSSLEQSDLGLHCLPFHLHLLDTFLHSKVRIVYMCGRFVWNKPLASFIHFIWNNHECKPFVRFCFKMTVSGVILSPKKLKKCIWINIKKHNSFMQFQQHHGIIHYYYETALATE